MINHLGAIKCKVIALCIAMRFVTSCREAFVTVSSVDVKDCVSMCEKDSRCATYYFKGSVSGRSTCALSEFGLEAKVRYQGIGKVLTKLRDDGPWDDQTAQQIRPAWKDSRDCSPDKTGDGTSPDDYCASGKHNCSINANCTAAAGTFKCSCTDGYQGDGVICDRVCSPGWHQFGGSCYQVYTDTNTWHDSSLTCQSKQASLVSITSIEENNFVQSIMSTSVAWIGLTRSGSPPSLRWSDSSTYSYNKWYSREPDKSGDCVYMRVRDGKWKDHSCSSPLAFVCKS